jgi:putative acetyltransferase
MLIFGIYFKTKMMQSFLFRPIKQSDNESLAKIIRSSIEALKLPTEGTAHSDPTTNNLSALFQNPKAKYVVAEENGTILGGCGVFPTEGLPPKHAELVRFFLIPEARGKGIGKQLMLACEENARALGFTHLYLESFPDMEAAIHLYKSFGYEQLEKPLGNSGHFSCNVWMLKSI